MLNFIKGRFANAGRTRCREVGDFVCYSNISRYGYQNVTGLAINNSSDLFVLFSSDGSVKILSPEGQHWYAHLQCQIKSLHLIGSGPTLIALCFHPKSSIFSIFVGIISGGNLNLAEHKCTNPLTIITCHIHLISPNEDPVFLLGSKHGHIYAISYNNSVVEDFLDFSQSALSGLSELFCKSRREISKISQHTHKTNLIFLLFNQNFIVLYDLINDVVHSKFASQGFFRDLYFSTNPEGKLFTLNHDETYTISKIEEDNRISFESTHSLMKSSSDLTFSDKIYSGLIGHDNELIILLGGVPSELSPEHCGLSLTTNGQSTVLDFGNEILDFTVLENQNGMASVLFIICQDEIVAIDLEDKNWRELRLPHLFPLHYSPITSMSAEPNLNEPLLSRLHLVSVKQLEMSSKFSPRPWPIRSNNGIADKNFPRQSCSATCKQSLIFTGHENGDLNVWLSCNEKLQLLITTSTSKEFQETSCDNELDRPCSTSSLDNEPNQFIVKKAGLVDSYSDDPRLSIRRILFDYQGLNLIVGGDSGQIFVYELNFDSKVIIYVGIFLILRFTIICFASYLATGRIVLFVGYSFFIIPRRISSWSIPAIYIKLISFPPFQELAQAESITVDLTSEVALQKSGTPSQQSKNKSRCVLPIRPRDSSSIFLPGFTLLGNLFLQFKPALPITAISWNGSSRLLAAGNEFGYFIFAYDRKEIIFKNCLISSIDFNSISEHMGPLSRFKSVHKTLRQSIRRKGKSLDQQFSGIQTNKVCGTTVIGNHKPKEREIMPRPVNPNILNGEIPNSLVKTLQFLDVSPSSKANTTGRVECGLFVGTQCGHVLVHEFSNRTHDFGSTISTSIISEIKLRHRAPIISIELHYDLPSSPKLLVFTEEQIRCFSFHLHSLALTRYKYRFTALEGSKIRRARIVNLTSLRGKSKATENFISIISNRGEVFVISLANPRKQICIQFTDERDLAGINSAFLARDGTLYFLNASKRILEKGSINQSIDIKPSSFRL